MILNVKKAINFIKFAFFGKKDSLGEHFFYTIVCVIDG